MWECRAYREAMWILVPSLHSYLNATYGRASHARRLSALLMLTKNDCETVIMIFGRLPPSFLANSRSTLIPFIRLIKQEIRSQLLVLVAGEIGLDDHVAFEAETAEL